jgi:hypothetical protein
MREIEQAHASAVDLYRTVYLLTGHSEFSLKLITDAIFSETDVELFWSAEMLTQLRRTVIGKALEAIWEELAFSACQTAVLPASHPYLPLGWSLDANTSKLQVESALLSIEVFPRCALLLTLFEGLSLADTSALLRSSEDLTAKGQVLGLWQLVSTLAHRQDQRPGAVLLPLTLSS